MLTQIQTKQQSDALSSEINTLLGKIYRVDSSKITIPALLQKEIGDNKINIKNVNEVKSFFEEIQEKLTKLAVLEITIAFSPSDAFITKLSSWAKNELGKNVILNIKIDTCILGGAIISCNGRYEDVSLKKSLGEYFKEIH